MDSSFATLAHNACYYDRLIGSVVVTVPSAAWLWQQGPKKGEHGHEHGEHEEHEGGEEESKDEGGEEGKADGGDESKEEGGDDKSEEKDDGPDEQHEGQGDSGKKAGTPGSPQTPESPEKPSKEDGDVPEGQVKKGKGEKQKGETRSKTETKGEKDVRKYDPQTLAVLVLMIQGRKSR